MKMTMKTKVSLSQQIEEVECELHKRELVYPRLVGTGKLRQSEARHHILRMENVLDTLKWLREHEAEIRARLSHNDNGSER